MLVRLQPGELNRGVDMAKSVKSIEKQIGKLEKEIEQHRSKMNAAKPADKFVHRGRMEGAQRELNKAKSALILAQAEASRKSKEK